jgi:hypothetical protein
MKITVFNLLCILTISAFGQSTSFGSANSVVPVEGELNDPTDVVASDLDGDGDKDILTISSLNDKVVWYENLDGLGTFGSQRLISDQADGVKSTLAIDIDGDGDIDVLSASSVDNTIAWHENLNGQGAFGPRQIITDNLNQAWDVEAADFDGDGDVDVAAISFEEKSVWFENRDGAGDFSNEMLLSDTSSPRAITIGDVDSDGDIDILTGSHSSGISLLKNDGLGNFEITSITASVQASNLNLHDFDLDGDLDLTVSFSGSSGSSYSFLYENTDGFGNFAFGAYFNFEPNSFNYSETIWPFDLDGDGDLDVLTSVFSGIGWCENDNGYCEAGNLNYIDGISGYFILEDLDNDDQLDIVLAGGGSVFWYKNEHDGQAVTFGPRQVISDYVPFDIYRFALADIDTDGAVDVVVTSPLDDFITWHKNMGGTGRFEVQDTFPINSRQIYPADFDNDGDPDLLVDDFSNGIAWYKNESNNFSLVQDFGINETIRNAIPKDLDGDGDLDIVVHKNLETIVWHENLNGLGEFGAQQVIIEDDNFSITKVAVADIDGDGDFDIPILNGLLNLEDSIAWLENIDASATSWETHIFFVDTGLDFEDRMIYLSVADINGDTNEDFIVTYPYKIVWFENIAGGYHSHYIIADSLRTPNIALKDLDNDGDIDLLAADLYGSYWYENLDGQGNFGSQNQFAVEGLRDEITAEDLDNDGDLDIIGSFFGYDKVFWYENFLIGPNSTNEVEKSTPLKIFPNPFTDHIHITMDARPNFSSVKATILTITGKLVVESTITLPETLDLSGSSLPDGIYIFHLTDMSSGKTLDSRLIIKQ